MKYFEVYFNVDGITITTTYRRIDDRVETCRNYNNRWYPSNYTWEKITELYTNNPTLYTILYTTFSFISEDEFNAKAAMKELVS